MDNFREGVLNFIQNTIRGKDISVRSHDADIIILENEILSFRCALVLKPIIYDGSIHKMKNEKIEGLEDYKLLYLWEDLWQFHRPKIESKLRSILGVTHRFHGRDTIVKPITNNELILFLVKNHLHVAIKARYKYGLFYNKELMAVMSFSKGRPINRNGMVFRSFELLRFCNKLNHTVVGGFSKLLQHFIRTVHPDDIMTYVDKDWSDGLTYEKAGFGLIQMLEPMEFLLNTESGERFYPHRVQLHISKGDETNLMAEESNLNECARVCNSGSYKYILQLKK